MVPRDFAPVGESRFFYILGNCFAYEKSVSEWKNVKKFVFYLTHVHLFDIFLLTVNEKGGG